MNKTNGSERDRTHGEVKWPLFQDMQNKVQTAVTNNSFQPSDFPLEKNNHIAHLSHTYTLPKGIDEDTLRNGVKYKDDISIIQQVYEALIETNPNLSTIHCKDKKAYYGVIQGVASRIPMEDIKYYVEYLGNNGSGQEYNDPLNPNPPSAKLLSYIGSFITEEMIRSKIDILYDYAKEDYDRSKEPNDGMIALEALQNVKVFTESKGDKEAMIRYYMDHKILIFTSLKNIRSQQFGSPGFIVSPETFFKHMYPML